MIILCEKTSKKGIACLKKIIRVGFSRHPLPKTKFGLPNLDFRMYRSFTAETFLEKRKYVFIKFEENR